MVRQRHEPSGVATKGSRGFNPPTATLVQWLPFRIGQNPLLKVTFSISASVSLALSSATRVSIFTGNSISQNRNFTRPLLAFSIKTFNNNIFFAYIFLEKLSKLYGLIINIIGLSTIAIPFYLCQKSYCFMGIGNRQWAMGKSFGVDFTLNEIVATYSHSE